MGAFACESRDLSGNIVKRTVDAESRREALSLLEQEGLFPLAINAVDAAHRAGTEDPAERDVPRGRTRLTGPRIDRRVPRKALRDFSLQLSSSMTAGVPILGALESIARQMTDRSFQAITRQLCVDLEGGLPLSEAMKNHPRAFPETYSSTVAAGEQSGALDEVLNRLAEYIESEIEVRADVRTAVLYPAMVVVALILAVLVLVIFVIPRFAVFYSGFDTALPLPTRILITSSELLTQYYLAGLVGLATLSYGCLGILRSRTGRRLFDRFLLRVPVVRQLLRTVHTLHVTQMIGLFSQAGIPLVQGLHTIAKTASSTKVGQDLVEVAQRVARGEKLSDSLEATDCLPPSARQMLAAGETTGSLDASCFTVAQHYKKELRYLTKNLATVIEPILTLGLAVIVLFVALAVFLPMWDLVKVVGG